MKVGFGLYSVGYDWTIDGVSGGPNEVPGLNISSTESLPPLNRAGIVRVKFARKKPETSSLWLRWETATGLRISFSADANDPRLKKQYQLWPEVAKQIVGLLFKASATDEPKAGKSLVLKGTLPPEEIPAEFRERATQIEVWAAFLKKKPNLFFQRYQSFVTGGGYYVVPIYRDSLLWPGRKFRTDVVGDYGPDSDESFDPAGMVPTIDDDSIYWTLYQKKIVVVLPHAHSTDEIAACYGYSLALRGFREAVAEEKREKAKDFEHWLQGREAAQDEIMKDLAASLLGE